MTSKACVKGERIAELRKRVERAVFSQPHLRALLDGIESVSVFVKSADGRLLFGNGSLLRHLGLRNEAELIGATDQDLFPPHLARKYRLDDLDVVRSGRVKLNLIELFRSEQGVLQWHVTHKYPVFGQRNRVIGVMGTIQEYGQVGVAIGAAERGVLEASEYIQKHYRDPISLERLTRLSGLPVRQFQRKFKLIFDASPREYITRHRLQHACEALRDSSREISEISIDAGFYDQSSFTRQFRRYLHVTPLKYRKGLRDA